VLGDGKLFRPRSYKDSLEELSQEAILIFNSSEGEEGSFEDLILKIQFKGKTERFAWVIPFPKEPRAEKEDSRLFEELHTYVQHRLAQRSGRKSDSKDGGAKGGRAPAERPVEILSRRTVGSYDVAIVRENQAGALNGWLEAEGYQSLPADAEDVIGFYRRKGYVFACIKVRDAGSGKDDTSALHPLRFSFRTGGFDGIYFPMKMSGLQSEPFNVNLHVFYHAWLNDNLNPADVRQWSDDLWLFPYYSQRSMVPYDARPGGIASAAWPGERYEAEEDSEFGDRGWGLWIGGGFAAVLLCVAAGAWQWRRSVQSRSVNEGIG
jgi:hypothetical protein